MFGFHNGALESDGAFDVSSLKRNVDAPLGAFRILAILHRFERI